MKNKQEIKKNTSLILLKNINKEYIIGDQKLKVLKDINLEINNGEFIAIMGASGSGKSTLLNILGCLDIPTSGEYYFEGRKISDRSEDELAEIRSKNIGFIFQSFNLINELSSLENVVLPSFYSGNEDLGQAKKMLEEVGLKDRIHHKPNELSGGQKQRVAIARAMINNPPLIFADEPTGNLDSKSGENVLEMIVELNRKGKTIIMVTHDEKIAEAAQRVIVLKDGEIVKKFTDAIKLI